nr:ATP-binding cassette domain-containing protein [Gammaproteobacteria bacterium]
STTCSETIMILAGMAVISFGAIMVIHQTLTVGGMIAIMVLIWRVLAPLKTIFNTLPRLQQMGSSLSQITRLMSISPESDIQNVNYEHKRKIIGPINFNRVSFRYQSASDPAVLGMEFTVVPGELIGIVGRNGSGKSSILKIILGMYQPQAGSIRIDNQDIRQINPIELRNGIGYLPQKPELFYGSIAANLRLAKPDATDDELKVAAGKAGILDDILSLSKGFDTPLRDHSMERLASSFQQLLCLARAYLKQANILLLDEPASVLDMDADKILMQSIESLRGKAIVMMVTHRPSHLKLMDRVFVVDGGQLVLKGKPEDVMEKIPKGML